MKSRNIHLPSASVILTAVIVLVLVTLAGTPPAEAADTYHGTFTSGAFFCNGNQISGPTVTGTWNLNIDANTPAQVTLNVFYDGSHHLSEGYNKLMQVSFTEGVYLFTGFGDSVTARLDTTVTPAAFSWHVELSGGCPPTHPYNSLTFFGVGNRGGE